MKTDQRWEVLDALEWRCTDCGGHHTGLFDLACARPEHWEGSEAYAPNSAARVSDHVLTEDFCVLDGEHFFVRSVLLLPLLGGNGHFGFGVWSTLSRKNFDIYMDGFDKGDQAHLGPWFGWFSNRLKGYPDTINLKCQVYPQNGRSRPLIEMEPTDHPLAVEQRDGLAVERLLEIYELNGHNVSDLKNACGL